MAKTHRCYCRRCHGKLVCKSTFYNHNPRGAAGMYHAGGAQRPTSTASRDTPVRGGPSSLNTPASGFTGTVIEEDSADCSDMGRPNDTFASDHTWGTETTRLETPQPGRVSSGHENSPVPSSSPRPPSPPVSRPSSPVPPGIDNSPRSSPRRRTPPVDDNDDDYPPAYLPSMDRFVQFARMVRAATLESQFDVGELEVLRNPQEHDFGPDENPYLKYSVRNFIDLLGSSQDTYSRIRQNILELFPNTPILSYDQVKRRVRRLSGVVTWEHHMCVNSCVGFTGPFSAMETCPTCGENRYDQAKFDASGGLVKAPRKIFTTFPVGPQLQARWSDPKMAEKMSYRQRKTQELRQEREGTGGTSGVYDDILSGEAYLKAVDDGMIGEHDTVLMFSIDGAQLYRHKDSDCWVYIWIILDLAPDERYKVRNILPGGVIPGPKPPGNIESFLFPGLAHLSAIQKEGLHIWDAYHQTVFLSFIFLLLVLADAVAMAPLSGSVGHHGRRGCWLLCGLVGRNKTAGSHYYPALLRPFGFEGHRTSSHPDIDITNLPDADPAQYRTYRDNIIASLNVTEHARHRFNAGISKPSIFNGIPRILPLPTCFAGDLMHQPVINIAALLFDLWCARPDLRSQDKSSDWPWAVLTGEVWKDHGRVVAHAAKFLPTLFGRTPRNPQEKISSGYKAWEFLYYLYGLGPGVFFEVLDTTYYSHFCKLVRAIRIIYQRRISQEQLTLAHRLLLEWCLEFETLYYQREEGRLHFVRQSVHSLTHLAKETHRLGPLSLSSQWTMERIISVLGSQLRQPSNPFANIAAQAQKMAHVNAIVAMWPSFDKAIGNPAGSVDLGNGYILLRPMEGHSLTHEEEEALELFCSSHRASEDINQGFIYRWGRLKLPTDQVARSVWKELERCSDMARTDRNVKILYGNTIRFAEVQFFFLKSSDGASTALAVVSLYSAPDEFLLRNTHDTLCVCQYRGKDSIVVIDVKSILSVIAMVPFPFIIGGHGNQHFMVEQIGLDIVETDVVAPPLDDLETP